MVRPALTDMVGVELCLFEERAHMVVVEAVLDLVPAPPTSLDQTLVLEQSKLVRHGRLADSGDDRQIPDAHRAGEQCVEEPGSCVITQSPKCSDYKVENFSVRLPPPCCADRGAIDCRWWSCHELSLSERMLR